MYDRLNRLGDVARRVTYYDHVNADHAVADFLGVPAPLAASPETIVEEHLVRLAVSKQPVREVLAEALGLPPPVWVLVGEERRHVFPDDPPEKPGDFDLVVARS